MEKSREERTTAVWTGRGGVGLFIFVGGLALAVSLGSYNPDDPAWNVQTATMQVKNLLGLPGAWIADLCFQSFGRGAWLSVLLALVCAASLWFQRHLPMRWLALAGFGLIAWTTAGLLHLRWGGSPPGSITAGGALGAWLAEGWKAKAGHSGAYIGLLGIAGVAATWTTRFSWWAFTKKLVLACLPLVLSPVIWLAKQGSALRLRLKERRPALDEEPEVKPADPSALPAHELPALALEPLWLDSLSPETTEASAGAKEKHAIPDLTPPQGVESFRVEEETSPSSPKAKEPEGSTQASGTAEGRSSPAFGVPALQIGPSPSEASLRPKPSGFPSLKLDTVALSIPAEERRQTSLPAEEIREEDIVSILPLSHASRPPSKEKTRPSLPPPHERRFVSQTPHVASPTPASSSSLASLGSPTPLALSTSLLPPLPPRPFLHPPASDAGPQTESKTADFGSFGAENSFAPAAPAISKTAEFGSFSPEDQPMDEATATSAPALGSSPPSEGDRATASNSASTTAAWPIPQGHTDLLLAIAQEQEEPEPQVLSALFTRAATQSRQAFAHPTLPPSRSQAIKFPR